MDRQEVILEYLQCRDRLAGPVQNHIGRIEVHSDVGTVHGSQELEQFLRRLLTGLQCERLSVPRAVVADTPHQLENAYVIRVGGLRGHAADVQCDSRNAESLGKIRHFVSPQLALASRLHRNESDGLSADRDAGIALAPKTREDGHYGHALPVQLTLPALGRSGVQDSLAMNPELPARGTEGAHRGHDFRGRGIAAQFSAGPEHKADLQGLQARHVAHFTDARQSVRIQTGTWVNPIPPPPNRLRSGSATLPRPVATAADPPRKRVVRPPANGRGRQRRSAGRTA